MKRPLSVGDKVAVYDFDLGRICGTVLMVNEEGRYTMVKVDLSVDYLWFYAKQCRRLRSKKTK